MGTKKQVQKIQQGMVMKNEKLKKNIWVVCIEKPEDQGHIDKDYSKHKMHIKEIKQSNEKKEVP